MRPVRLEERSAFADRFFLFLGDFLAVEAQVGGRAGFQAAQADLDAARLAPAVFVGLDLVEGLVDFLDQLALAVAVAQLKGEFFFLAGTVGRVGKLAASSFM